MAQVNTSGATWELVPPPVRTVMVGVGLLGVLAVVVLGRANGGPEWLRSWVVASALVAFAGALLLARYGVAAASDGLEKPFLVDYQLVLVVGLVGILYQSRTPGYGVGLHRGLEAFAVFAALVAFCTLAGDPRRYDPFQWIVLGCFAVVAGIFFYHSVDIVPVSARARHPVWWGVTAGLSLIVLPQYVPREMFLWAISRLAAALVLLTLPIYVLGEFTMFGLQFTFHEGYVIPILEQEIRATRSLFVNRNAFALVVFAGLIAAIAELHRAFGMEWKYPFLPLVIPSVLVAVNSFGFAIAFGRALWVISLIAFGIYGAYVVFDRRAVPIAALVGLAYLAVGIGAVHSGMIGVPEGTPTRANRWYPAIAAIADQPTLLGEGLIATGSFTAPYHPTGSTGSPHNSYLSIWIRTGILGGVAYLGIAVVSVLRGLWRYRDVDVAVFALAVCLAAHQLFEAYTMFQTGSSSILVALSIGMLVFGRPDPDSTGEGGRPALPDDDTDQAALPDDDTEGSALPDDQTDRSALPDDQTDRSALPDDQTDRD